MPMNDFMNTLQYLILGMIGVTVVAFTIVAYVVCKMYEKKD